MLINSVYIKEFRGIREMRESITLGRLNVLIGRNNSGKSAFLEALSLFPIPFNAYHAPFLDSSRIQLIA